MNQNHARALGHPPFKWVLLVIKKYGTFFFFELGLSFIIPYIGELLCIVAQGENILFFLRSGNGSLRDRVFFYISSEIFVYKC